MPFKTQPTIISDQTPPIIVQDLIRSKIYQLEDENDAILVVQDLPLSYSDPDGPSDFDLWRADGHPDGTFEDYLAYEKGFDPTPSPGTGSNPGTGTGTNPGTGTTPVIAETFTFIQNIAESIWTIKHNLNRYPSVTLVDTFGDKFEADQRYIDANTIEVKFIAPTAGTAFLN